MKKLVIIFICLAFISFSSCSWWNTKAYYATHQMTAEDVWFWWGKPFHAEVLDNGMIKWVYFIDDPWYYGEYYFLIKEDRVVDFGLN